MKTPYIPHLFGEEATSKVQARQGWATVGVISSIAWPQDDVWLQYDGQEYFLHGIRQRGEHTTSPCVSAPCDRVHVDDAIARLYRFVSVLGYFKRGYVDITSRMWGTFPIPNVTLHGSLMTMTQAGSKTFSCNHMPIIEDDQVRKALAFLREGRRLRHLHEPYSFLSFFKVLESQFEAKDRKTWFEKNLDHLGGDAAKRVAELKAQGMDVSDHLYVSGRCAVAHASLSGEIVDPDIPADRKRIAADLDIMASLATRYLKLDAGVPDEMDLYENRNRVAPWHTLMTPKAVEVLKSGGCVEDVVDLGQLEGATVKIRLWPDPPAAQFQAMKLLPLESGDGSVKLIALNARNTIVLAFGMDVANGRMHTLLNESGIRQGSEVTEQDVEDFTRYFHSVIGNRIVELTIEGAEPVDCDVVMPVNIIPQAPEDAVALALEQFRRARRQDC